MLYEKLDYLKEKVLQFDTDSIIYTDDGTKNLLTDELNGKAIVSTGPAKNL